MPNRMSCPDCGSTNLVSLGFMCDLVECLSPECEWGGHIDQTQEVEKARLDWVQHLKDQGALNYRHDYRLFQVVEAYIAARKEKDNV